MKRLYASASIVSAERIVFTIKGNDYRLVLAVDFEKSIFGSERDLGPKIQAGFDAV